MCLAVRRADRFDLLPKVRVGAVQPQPNTMQAEVAGQQGALQVAAADLPDYTGLNQFTCLNNLTAYACPP